MKLSRRSCDVCHFRDMVQKYRGQIHVMKANVNAIHFAQHCSSQSHEASESQEPVSDVSDLPEKVQSLGGMLLNLTLVEESEIRYENILRA